MPISGIIEISANIGVNIRIYRYRRIYADIGVWQESSLRLGCESPSPSPSLGPVTARSHCTGKPLTAGPGSESTHPASDGATSVRVLATQARTVTRTGAAAALCGPGRAGPGAAWPGSLWCQGGTGRPPAGPEAAHNAVPRLCLAASLTWPHRA